MHEYAKTTIKRDVGYMTHLNRQVTRVRNSSLKLDAQADRKPATPRRIT